MYSIRIHFLHNSLDYRAIITIEYSKYMEANFNKPDILEYDSYRRYLRDTYAFLKQEQSHFSFRFFSRMAGFSSPNFLKLVMEEQRNLSAESVEKFIKALKLTGKDASHFRQLVLLEQSATLEEKKFYAEQLLKSKNYKKLKPLSEKEFAYYANWFYIPIREMVALPHFQENPRWIAEQLVPKIQTSEAKKALDDLIELGMLKRNNDGRLTQTDSSVSTGDNITSTSVINFHQTMAKLGGESIKRIHHSQRDISSVTITLSRKNFDEMKKLVQNFRRELLALSEKDPAPDEVYQLNFHFFPLTDIKGKEGDKKTDQLSGANKKEQL